MHDRMRDLRSVTRLQVRNSFFFSVSLCHPIELSNDCLFLIYKAISKLVHAGNIYLV